MPEFAERVFRLQRIGSKPALGRAEVPLMAVQAAVNAALDRGETHYTDRPGILPLREKIAAMLRDRFGMAVDAREDVVVSCGVIEARFVALQQMLSPGERIWAPIGAERIQGAVELRRAELTVDLGDGAMRLLYLASSADEDLLRARLAELGGDGLVLFEVDDAESRFHPALVDGFAGRTVTVGQLGDASWQIGYLVCPGKASAGMREFKQALTICSTNLSQWAALAE